MDALSLHQAGFGSAVATLGTAVTGDQARLIGKYASRAVLAYDSDEAGKRAMDKAAALLGEAGVETQVLGLDGAKDPDEFINKYGREKLAEHLNKPKGYRETLIDAALEKYDLDIPGEARKAIDEACSEIAKIKEALNREVYAVYLSGIFKLPPDSFFKKIEDCREKHISNEKQAAKKQFDERIKKEEVTTEEAILGALLNYPVFYKEVKDILDEEYFTEGFYRRIFLNLKENIETPGFDTAALNGDFTEEEMGKIIRMTISEAASKFLNRADKLKDYINMFAKRKKYGLRLKEPETEYQGGDTGWLEKMQKIRAEKL